VRELGEEKALRLLGEKTHSNNVTEETKSALKRSEEEKYNYDSYDFCMKRAKYWMHKSESTHLRRNEEAALARAYIQLATELREAEKDEDF
jgi:hypothetical protein